MSNKNDSVTDKDELCHLLASAWYHGRWRAETFNEKRMEEIMVRLGFWPTTYEKLLVGRAAIDAARREELREWKVEAMEALKAVQVVRERIVKAIPEYAHEMSLVDRVLDAARREEQKN